MTGEATSASLRRNAKWQLVIAAAAAVTNTGSPFLETDLLDPYGWAGDFVRSIGFALSLIVAWALLTSGILFLRSLRAGDTLASLFATPNDRLPEQKSATGDLTVEFPQQGLRTGSLASCFTLMLAVAAAFAARPLLSESHEFGQYPRLIQTRMVLPILAAFACIVFLAVLRLAPGGPTRQHAWVVALASAAALSGYAYNFVWLPGVVNAGPFQPMSKIAHAAFWSLTVLAWAAWAVVSRRPHPQASRAVVVFASLYATVGALLRPW